MGAKLTPKQAKFVDYYIELGNATQAAIKAGYSQKTAKVIARENLTKPYLRDEIEKRLVAIESKRIATAKEVMEYLTSVLRGETEAEEIVVEGCGDGYSEARRIQKAPSEKERLKAAEQLCRRFDIASGNTQDGQVVIIDDTDQA